MPPVSPEAKARAAAKARERYALNREKRLAQVNEYRKANLVRYAALARLRWSTQPEQRKRQQRYREANKARVAEWEKRYKQANPHTQAAARHRRRARMLGAGPGLTSAEWAEVLAEFDYRCAYCHKSSDALELEHMVPLVQGGSNARRNVVPACGDCNRQKGVLNAFEFLSKPRSLAS